MKIYDQSKTKELNREEINFSLGYLIEDKLFIKHHDAVVGQKEEGHYETIKEYPNGGKDVKWVVDVPAVEAKEAYDEYENIQIYIPYTEEELQKIANEQRCFELKTELVKIKEDIEQETFGIIREDFAEKKARAAEIINELRGLEGKEPRKLKETK